MLLLRRLLPSLALLVCGVVAVQALDLVACADEIVQVGGHAEASHGAHGSETVPDCLCHLTFTPSVEAPRAMRYGPTYETHAPQGPGQAADGALQRLDRPPRG